MATAKLQSTTTTQDNQGHTSTTAEYIVYGLAVGATDSTILSTTGIPSRGDALSGSGGAIAYQRKVTKKVPDNTTAIVSIEYSTNPNKIAPGGNEPDDDRDPTTDPPTINVDPQNSSVVRYEDYSAPPKAYINTAKQDLPFQVEVDDPRCLVVYSKKVASLSLAVNLAYSGTVNESDFTLTTQGFTLTIGKGLAMFKGVGYKQAFYTDSSGTVRPYWNADYQFLVRAEKWNPLTVYSSGTAQLVKDPADPAKKVWKQIEFKGLPVTGLCPLDAAGAAIDPTTGALGHKMTFKQFRETNFSGIGIS